MVRRYRSSGMSPRPMCSSIAGWMLPRSRSLRTCRSGTAKAVAIASSVQFFEARSSSRLARGRWATSARARRFRRRRACRRAGSAGLTRIAISLSLLAMALLDAAAARDDGEGPVSLFGEERRLNESDRIAVGFEGRVGQAIGGDLPRVSACRRKSGSWDRRCAVRLSVPWFAPGLSGSVSFPETANPGSAGAGPGQRRRKAPGLGPDQRSGRPNPPFAAGARPCSLALSRS